MTIITKTKSSNYQTAYLKNNKSDSFNKCTNNIMRNKNIDT